MGVCLAAVMFKYP